MKKLLLLPLFLFSLTAKAQVYSLSPLIMEVEIAPGESKDFPLNIRNLTQSELINYQIKIEEFIYDDKKEKTNTKDTTSKNPKSLVPFAKVAVSKFDIKPKSDMKINLNVTIPKDMKGSGYLRYTVIQGSMKDEKKTKGFALRVKQNYTGMLFVRIKGTEEKKFDLVNLKYDKNKVSFDFKNTGNTYLKLKADAYILKNDKKTTKINIANNKNEETFYVFPDKIRPLFFNLAPQIAPKGKEKVKILLTFYDPKSSYSISRVVEVSQ